MSKTTTLVLLLILVAAGGIILFGRQKVQMPAATDNTNGGVSITQPGATAPATSGTESAGTQGSSTAGQQQQTPTVAYNDQGFTPAVLTVKAGTAVTFVNQSSGTMWVASNPHPTHTDLPGFDEHTAVPNGGTYTYTFVKAGTWGYHNHVNPSDGGTVVVQ